MSRPGRYDVVAVREGDWWVLDVEGVGVTQCRELADAAAQVRGLLEAVLDTGAAAAEVRIHAPESDSRHQHGP